MRKYIKRFVEYIFADFLKELRLIRKTNQEIYLLLRRIDDPKMQMLQPLGPIRGLRTFGDRL